MEWYYLYRTEGGPGELLRQPLEASKQTYPKTDGEIERSRSNWGWVSYSLGLSLHVVPGLEALNFVRSKSLLGAWLVRRVIF